MPDDSVNLRFGPDNLGTRTIGAHTGSLALLGGEILVTEARWARTQVDKASSYAWSRCGRKFTSPTDSLSRGPLVIHLNCKAYQGGVGRLLRGDYGTQMRSKKISPAI
jgi:hypothetical protein